MVYTVRDAKAKKFTYSFPIPHITTKVARLIYIFQSCQLVSNF